MTVCDEGGTKEKAQLPLAFCGRTQDQVGTEPGAHVSYLHGGLSSRAYHPPFIGEGTELQKGPPAGKPARGLSPSPRDHT